jgi:hypothetical protein
MRSSQLQTINVMLMFVGSELQAEVAQSQISSCTDQTLGLRQLTAPLANVSDVALHFNFIETGLVKNT